jgi:uncharacterized protein YjbJ (UPF0337 family)
MKTSTKDKIEGSFHEVKGTIMEEVGKVTNDRNLKAGGKAEKKAGKVQQRIGHAKEAVAKLKGQLAELKKLARPFRNESTKLRRPQGGRNTAALSNLNVALLLHHLRALNIRARAMISTTPNIHIQPMFHPSIPYPCTGPPPESLLENRGHCKTHFF